MASNYTVNGHGDLDSIFLLYGAAGYNPTKASATGFKVGSQDLADRYSQVNGAGFDLIGFSTYYKSKNPHSGAPSGDLRYIFEISGY
jgi:hypothetical protein